MSDTITITISPLPCCRMLAVQHRCGESATTAQITRLADGSYHVQPYCHFCTQALGLAAPVASEENSHA